MTHSGEREAGQTVDEDSVDETRVAGLLTLMAADEVETVPDSPELIRVDGEVKRLLPNAQRVIGGGV